MAPWLMMALAVSQFFNYIPLHIKTIVKFQNVGNIEWLLFCSTSELGQDLTYFLRRTCCHLMAYFNY